MRFKRLMLGTVGGLVMTPVALATGVVLLVSAYDKESGDTVPRGADAGTDTLRVGAGGVPSQYVEIILDAARSCSAGLSPAILSAQIKQESGFDPRAGSPVGAQGIAQFMPGTWRTWGVDGNGDGRKDVWDPEDAIPAQARFMCALLKKGQASSAYRGSPVELALAGYNAGWGRVQEYQGVPPASFAAGQTHHYVENIMTMSASFATPAETTTTLAAAEQTSTKSVTSAKSLTSAPQSVRTAVAWALGQRGGWYQWGGDCTDAHGSAPAHRCDCSSLMQQAYAAAGIAIPRTTFDQVRIGTRVDLDKPLPGDLVFNAGSDGSDARPGHVGMYIGDGLVIEAPRTGVQTRVVPYASWRNSTSALTRVTEIRRVVDQ
ncbi:NlpC/P60 family protein [Streptomyces sp. R1]|uniref:C40 family peptidase n=1 Tax=Streptomyces sp. R1 TaxID=1509279 RepID=UPI001E6562FD|nr:NlpC/P60 family protein [Streptomyces sp. R1]MCC8338943.1 NlpC/P60 family protein [Streptomyces sp. R1]